MMVLGQALLMGQGAYVQSAMAAESEPTAKSYQFNIPSKPLPQAIADFSAVTGLQVLYTETSTFAHKPPSLQGTFTQAQALSQLLAGSGLVARHIASGAVTIEKPMISSGETTLLDPINVIGARSVNGYVPRTARTATRISTDLMETPRAVSVVTSEQMEDLPSMTLEDAISYAPGVVINAYGLDKRYDEFIVRGFEQQTTGTYRDGMVLRTFAWAAWRTEPFGVERIEIFRGTTGDLYGANEPGGLVNTISKRPKSEFEGEVKSTFFGFGGYELAGDVTGPIDEAGKFSYRLVAVVKDAKTETEKVTDKRYYFAPSVTYTPNADTSVTILTQFQKDTFGDSYQLYPDYGTLYNNPAGNIEPGTFYGDENHNTIKTDQLSIGYELEHKLTDNLTFRSKARYGDNDWYFDALFGAGYTSISMTSPADTLVRAQFYVDQTTQQMSLYNSVEYEIQTKRLEGHVMTGVDYFNSESDTDYSYGYGGDINLYTGAVTNYFSAYYPTTYHILDNDMEQVGIYATGQVKLDDRWIVSASLRYDDVTQTTKNEVGTVTADDQAMSGSVGFAYKTSFGVTPYANYATSFAVPASGVSPTFEPLKAEEAEQFELGVRYAPQGEDFTLSLATYQTTKTNDAVDDPSDPTGFVFLQTGETRVRGVEVEGRASLGYGFSAIGSYSYVNAEVIEDPVYKGKRPAHIPEQSGSAWVSYKPQSEFLSGVSLGAGVRYTGERFAESANTIKLASVTLVDAQLGYELDGVKLSLKAQNLFDKEYVGNCSLATAAPLLPGNLCTYGAGRNVTFTISHKF